MRSRIDHLVVVCRTLEQGDAWLHGQLGVHAQPGGRHANMGTHNWLLRLGSHTYLELIAIDPAAAPPARPRWFDLDAAAVQARAAAAPFLHTWAVASDDAALAAARVPALGEPQALERGPLRWLLTLNADGSTPFSGLLPAVIQWLPGADGGPAHPCEVLADRGCALRALELSHPAAASLLPLFRALRIEGPVELKSGPRDLAARIATKAGEVVLR